MAFCNGGDIDKDARLMEKFKALCELRESKILEHAAWDASMPAKSRVGVAWDGARGGYQPQ